MADTTMIAIAAAVAPAVLYLGWWMGRGWERHEFSQRVIDWYAGTAPCPVCHRPRQEAGLLPATTPKTKALEESSRRSAEVLRSYQEAASGSSPQPVAEPTLGVDDNPCSRCARSGVSPAPLAVCLAGPDEQRKVHGIIGDYCLDFEPAGEPSACTPACAVDCGEPDLPDCAAPGVCDMHQAPPPSARRPDEERDCSGCRWKEHDDHDDRPERIAPCSRCVNRSLYSPRPSEERACETCENMPRPGGLVAGLEACETCDSHSNWAAVRPEDPHTCATCSGWPGGGCRRSWSHTKGEAGPCPDWTPVPADERSCDDCSAVDTCTRTAVDPATCDGWTRRTGAENG